MPPLAGPDPPQRLPSHSRTFIRKRDAERWARRTEADLESGETLQVKTKDTAGPCRKDLVLRYRDTVSSRKKGHKIERVILNAFLRHPICKQRAKKLGSADFAVYRDHRLGSVRPATLRKEFSIIHHLFEVVRKLRPLERVRLRL